MSVLSQYKYNSLLVAQAFLCADFKNLHGYVRGTMARFYPVEDGLINYREMARSVQVSPACQLAAADSSQACLGSCRLTTA